MGVTFRERLGAGCDITAGSRVLVDYTQFHEVVPHLTLEESLGGYFSAVDQHGRLFTPPSRDMNVPIRLMRAMAIRGHATLDEESITWFRALRAGEQHSLKVSSVEGEPGGGADLTAVPVSSAMTSEPTSPSRQIGAASPHPPVPGAVPIRLRLVN